MNCMYFFGIPRASFGEVNQLMVMIIDLYHLPALLPESQRFSNLAKLVYVSYVKDKMVCPSPEFRQCEAVLTQGSAGTGRCFHGQFCPKGYVKVDLNIAGIAWVVD